MSGVRKVMLKATFRILLARDKPERALQAAEEAVLPFFFCAIFSEANEKEAASTFGKSGHKPAES